MDQEMELPVKITIKNYTKIDFGKKRDRIYDCVKTILKDELESLHVTCDDVGYKTPNFTTAGLYRLHGKGILHNNEEKSWKIMIKVIKPDSGEKNLARHHNYWRREALVLESGILQELPDSIQAAACYLVEESPDGTLWLWMEYMDGEYAATMEQFSFIARQLGLFNGAYVTGEKALPAYDWICKGWLRSWTTASRLYSPNVEAYINSIAKGDCRAKWEWYEEIIRKLDAALDSLQLLPRVLAHQDLSQMNMLLHTSDTGEQKLALIDWQFMSISGLGEDLGKLFGVNMSLGIIQPDQYDEFQTTIYQSYLEGLHAAGWHGDDRVVRYGFCLSMALRSVWEIPQFFSILSQSGNEPQNKDLADRLARLEKIITIQQSMDQEAEWLKSELSPQLTTRGIKKRPEE
ncbi:phosphotransferase [Paenibacillus nanensis]|nr:phosphotransferase [Paenibacillus nanensis]